MLCEISAGCGNLFAPKLAAFDDSRLATLVSLLVSPERTPLVKASATQLAAMHPNGVHTLLVNLQITSRLACIRTIRKVAIGRVLLHVRLQICTIRESFPATNMQTFDNAPRARLVLLRVQFEIGFILEHFSAVEASDEKAFVNIDTMHRKTSERFGRVRASSGGTLERPQV